MIQEIEGENLHFISQSVAQQAINKQALKDVNFEELNMLDETLTPNENKFTANSVVFWRSKNCFAKVVSFDSDKNNYCLKPRTSASQEESKGSLEEIVDAADITQRVYIHVHKRSQNDDNLKNYQRCIEINEPISKQLADVSKTLIFNGSIIDKEATAQELDLGEGQTLLALGAGGAGRITPKEWRRSKRFYEGGGYGMRREYYDALTFKARGNTTIYGFMFSNEANGKDFTIQVSWCKDDEEFPEDTEFTVSGTDGLGEDFFHRFDFQDFGIEPVPLQESGLFHIRAKCPTSGVSFGYVSNGEPHVYHNIEGQENMFHTNTHCDNQNSTYYYHGMFPGILYYGGVVNEDIKQYSDEDYDDLDEEE